MNKPLGYLPLTPQSLPTTEAFHDRHAGVRRPVAIVPVAVGIGFKEADAAQAAADWIGRALIAYQCMDGVITAPLMVPSAVHARATGPQWPGADAWAAVAYVAMS